MLLALDIGNSSAKFGLFDRAELVTRRSVPTPRGQTAAEIYESVKNDLPAAPAAVVVSSVVPETNAAIREFGERFYGRTPFFVHHGLPLDFEIRYQPPENLGIDRLVAAYAARARYGAPSIVCDFGTATTIDAVGPDGDFLGGVITPGPQTLSEALFLKTSKLPRIALRDPGTVLGRSTEQAIEAGIYYGYLGLTEGLIGRLQAALGRPARVVATGGFAPLIAAGCPLVETLDDRLMLDGLRLIYEKLFPA